jgi:dolichyl-phosphate-mannose--protein O-mannosyl transferase
VLFSAVIGVGAALRLYSLGSPGALVFDEVYYTQDACSYLGWGEQVCGVAREASWVHPPLGKWLIALGILLFGYEPTGWRIVPVLAGIATVGLTYALARRLTGSSLVAVVAGGILALDPLSIVQSRVGMLDILTTCAGMAAVLFAVMDRDALVSRARQPGDVMRPWLIAAGLAGGAAAACKWSGALALGAVILLVLAWEVSAGRRAGQTTGRALRAAAPAILVWLVALPALVYAASYAGRLEGDLLAWPWLRDSWVRQFGGRQLQMLQFHAGLDETHRAASPAWSWLLGKRAVVYFFDVDAAGRYREILAFANPVLWVPAAISAATAGIIAIRRRALWGPEAVIAIAAAATYLPWLVLTIGRPFVFLHYIVPTVPFLALAIGWAVGRLPRVAGRSLAVAAVAVATIVVLYWSPLIYAWPLDYDAWRSRIVFTDCGPEALTPDGRLMPQPTVATTPPPGWCWV